KSKMDQDEASTQRTPVERDVSFPLRSPLMTLHGSLLHEAQGKRSLRPPTATHHRINQPDHPIPMSKPKAYRVKAYTTTSATSPLAAAPISRREPTETDVQIEILYCGVCHSDLHFARNEWGFTQYPAVPGHEIVGRVTAVGGAVTKVKVGDLAGVGCLVD